MARYTGTHTRNRAPAHGLKSQPLWRDVVGQYDARGVPRGKKSNREARAVEKDGGRAVYGSCCATTTFPADTTTAMTSS